MHGKIRFSRWLIAATVLALAECASLAFDPFTPAVAQAQSSGGHFRQFQSLFGSLNWSRQQRKPHQSSDNSRTSQRKTKLKPEQTETTAAAVERKSPPRVLTYQVPNPMGAR